MKKLLALALGVLATCLCLSGCAQGSSVKVLKEYELTSETYAFAIKKGNTELKTTVDQLLAEIKGNGELDKIINGFFDGTTTFEYTNPSSESGCFVVATNAYFPPFEYYNGSKLSGIDIKIASLIAEKLEKTLYVKDMDFSAVIPSVKEGQCDIGIAGLTVNDERLLQVDFSDGYYSSAQVLIVKEDDADYASCKSADDVLAVLNGKAAAYKVGAQNGTTGYMFSAGDEGFGYDGFKNLTTVGYTTGALAVLDLSNGKINAVIIDKQPALQIAAATNAKFSK